MFLLIFCYLIIRFCNIKNVRRLNGLLKMLWPLLRWASENLLIIQMIVWYMCRYLKDWQNWCLIEATLHVGNRRLIVQIREVFFPWLIVYKYYCIIIVKLLKKRKFSIIFVYKIFVWFCSDIVYILIIFIYFIDLPWKKHHDGLRPWLFSMLFDLLRFLLWII